MKTIVLILGLVLVLSGAALCADPYWPDTSWRTSTPDEQGVKSVMITDMLQSAKEKGYDLHSFLLVRHGYLVAERYFGSYTSRTPHDLYSATKSVTSALLGIAMAEGYVKGVDSRLGDYFTDAPPEKTAITIEQLLTMCVGFPGIDVLPSSRFTQESDALKFIFGLPLQFTTGDRFLYNNPSPHLISNIIKATTGSNELAYAQKRLFTPLGIDANTWMADRSGNNIGGTGLRLTPLEMAKFGYLYLMNGVWNGRQVVPAAWVKTSTTKHIEGFDMNYAERYGYGYFWWLNSFGGFSAHGAFGQYIFVIPGLDLVAVFTSNLEDFPAPYRLMEQYIVPAVKEAQ